MRLEGGEARKGGRKSHCATSDRKQDWREVADDTGLGSARQRAHHELCEEPATELLLEININKHEGSSKVKRKAVGECRDP